MMRQDLRRLKALIEAGDYPQSKANLMVHVPQ